METFAKSPPSRHLAERILRLARKLAAQEARDLEAVAIGSTQHAMLELLIATPGLCLTVVAERLAVHKSVVTRAARRLELNGYVERRRSPRDGRAWELFPTRSGGIASWVARPSTLVPAARLLVGFRDEDLLRLSEYLERMSLNLDVTAAEVVRREALGSTDVRWQSNWGECETGEG